MVATQVLWRRGNGWMPLLTLTLALCMPMSAAVLPMKKELHVRDERPEMVTGNVQATGEVLPDEYSAQ